MSDFYMIFPSNNLRKMKRVAELDDTELFVKFGILTRQLPSARQFIARRIEQMIDGLKKAA